MPKTFTPEDDLKVGMFICAVDLKEKGPNNITESVFGYSSKRDFEATGYPMKIEAIDLPFLLVSELDGSIGTIDTRKVQVKGLSRSYVSKFRSAVEYTSGKGHHHGDLRLPDKPTKKEKRERRQLAKERKKRTCKRCGSVCEKQRLIEPGKSKWVWWCPNCEAAAEGAELE